MLGRRALLAAIAGTAATTTAAMGRRLPVLRGRAGRSVVAAVMIDGLESNAG